MTLRALRPRIATLDQRTARPPPKTTNRFYLSPEWRSLVAEIIAQRGLRCEECGRREPLRTQRGEGPDAPQLCKRCYRNLQ